MDYLEIHSLYHHGVKGQRWGVRRYQNEDGTLTEEGKERYSKLDRKFRQNVLDVESRIATANLHNLQSGRKHDDDDYISESIRKSVIRKQKVGKKMLKKLLDSGYMQQQYGFDPKKVDYSSFMQAIENVAAKEYISKYGKFRISEFDSDGSEDYELAILDYTTKQGLAHVGTCDIEELYHHGIKGQKWGIRRYQNEDGTLTDEGKRRYGTVGLKEVSLNTIEKERHEYREKLTNSTDDMKKAKLLEDKARALAKKYDFDPDDGGSGSTKESQDAGIKYMELWKEIDRLREPYSYGGQKYYEFKKKTEEYLTNKYGTFRMNMLKTKENAPKIAFGAMAVAALLAAGYAHFKFTK